MVAGLIWSLAGCSSTEFSAPNGTTARAATTANSTTPGSGSSSTSGSGPGAGSGTESAGVGGPGTPDAATSGSGSVSTALPVAPTIGFGMLVNDLNCTFCHLEVHGTVVSVATVPPFRSDSHGEVYGNWFVNGAFNAPQGLSNPPMDNGILVSTGAATANYANTGKELPVSPTTKQIGFPAVDFTALATTVQGNVHSSVASSSPASVSKTYTGNVVMVGTQAQPIVIDRDVLVQGDLIITGYYTGVGTIYATGNIYIPADLKALSPAGFPYSDDPAAADKAAKADLSAGTKDGLGLATAKSLFVGDLENYMDNANGNAAAPDGLHGTRFVSIYTQDSTSALYYSTSNVWEVYSWYPEAKFELLYQDGTPCWTSSTVRALVAGHHWGEREVDEIDAYLYAAQNIAGIDRARNWTINGGMIAQAMHIVSGAGWDSAGTNAQCPASRINFDYRMRNGLQILEGLSAYFPSTTTATN